MTQHQIRFQFGGHATFPLRYGWLPKGLGQLQSEVGFTANTETADDLGLGSKMVESLGYWLHMTGLTATAKAPLRGSRLASLIAAHDPFFERPGTWWFLHLMLTHRQDTIWGWFFNDYSDRIFDRLSLGDAFLQHAQRRGQRPPTAAMVQRDVACLLSAYATRPGVDIVDPDEIGACPLRELGLLIRQDAVSRYERTRRPHGVPQEVFLACAAEVVRSAEIASPSLRELANLPGGPGRILCMGLDAIETMVGKIGSKRYLEGINVESVAGERRLTVPPHAPDHWLALLYERVGRETAS